MTRPSPSGSPRPTYLGELVPPCPPPAKLETHTRPWRRTASHGQGGREQAPSRPQVRMQNSEQKGQLLLRGLASRGPTQGPLRKHTTGFWGWRAWLGTSVIAVQMGWLNHKGVSSSCVHRRRGHGVTPDTREKSYDSLPRREPLCGMHKIPRTLSRRASLSTSSHNRIIPGLHLLPKMFSHTNTPAVFLSHLCL